MTPKSNHTTPLDQKLESLIRTSPVLAEKFSKKPKTLEKLVDRSKSWSYDTKSQLYEKLVKTPKSQLEKSKNAKKIIHFIQKVDHTIFAGDRTIDKSKVDL